MNQNLRSLIIRNTPWLNDECIELFTAFCHKLCKIELQGCLTNITRSGIESIGRNCGSLLSLSIISTDEVRILYYFYSIIYSVIQLSIVIIMWTVKYHKNIQYSSCLLYGTLKALIKKFEIT